MSNPNGDGMGGFGFRQPSQRESITGGYEGGVRIPIVQAFASIVFALLGILFIWLLLFVIGPDTAWIAGFVLIIFAARRTLLWIGTAQQEMPEEINGARAMTIATLILMIVSFFAWSSSRQFIIDRWPAILPQVSAWRTVFAISFIIPPIVVCGFMAFQFLVNAYNPAVFQPHQAKPAGTPWWSPTGQTIIETESNNDEYPPAQVIRTIPRPIPAYSNGNPNPNGNRLQEQLTDASERQHRTPPESEGLPEGAFIAPNGRTVRIEDLAEFLLNGVTIGATYAVWHKRKGWGENYWQALYGTCAQHGFAKPSRLKSRSRFLVKSRREAAQAIEHLKRYLFDEKLSPHPIPQSVWRENGDDAL